ncbi:GNAT family N-acetyltransferase [Aliiroseovarius sp. KMU-50]|uniref:GNAT family N-acetyltransferase n=1 Tax=Aliiroseovarius salicola TaxID=3009082 RepID=A0ABT4VYG7_9RHOB|nr:GNAT family N-acetyltransferase [Aliiroseovarius sp. KMU-50]MDA5093315.1 GNAT family N-acetyltransferase [Aliiroseovarius sp. KMU-50]
MIRPARHGDEAAMMTFLSLHAETTMFMRAGLARFGLASSDHPHAAKYWVEDKSGEIVGVFSRSNAGFLNARGEGAIFWQGFHEAMQGQQIAGLNGAADIVKGMRAVLALEDAAYDLNRVEPLYRLDLDQMRDPGPDKIRKPKAEDADLLTRWFRAYHIEALGAADDETLTRVIADRVESTIATGHVRLMIEDGQPVAMTAFNAQLPDMVQIGGVYTPPEARGRGLARRVVAAHLNEVRAEGVKTAILFASGDAACRAYEAIGFERTGEYTLAILSHPVTIGVRI